MQRLHRKATCAFLSFFPLLLLVLPRPALAVDGVTELSQAGILAAGGFPAAAGSLGGSHVLTSNLAPPAGTNAIQVTSDDVTIDLNGFTIDGGSGGCTGSGTSISCPAGTGIGIAGTGRARVTVRNGIVKNFAQDCVELGDEALVDGITVTGCTVRGIEVGEDSLVRENIAVFNGEIGIKGVGQLEAIDNISAANGGHGIRALGNALVSGNVAIDNGNRGISTNSQALIRANVAARNESGGIDTDNRSRIEANVASANPAGPGILALSDASIEGNSASSNGSMTTSAHGIDCNFRCSIIGNAVNGNSNDGIHTGGAGAVNYNAASLNTNDGIDCDSVSANSCSILGNTAIDNVNGYGLRLTAAGAVSGVYKKNTFDSNGAGDVSQTGADPGFQNTCSGTVPCP